MLIILIKLIMFQKFLFYLSWSWIILTCWLCIIYLFYEIIISIIILLYFGFVQLVRAVFRKFEKKINNRFHFVWSYPFRFLNWETNPKIFLLSPVSLRKPQTSIDENPKPLLPCPSLSHTRISQALSRRQPLLAGVFFPLYSRRCCRWRCCCCYPVFLSLANFSVLASSRWWCCTWLLQSSGSWRTTRLLVFCRPDVVVWSLLLGVVVVLFILCRSLLEFCWCSVVVVSLLLACCCYFVRGGRRCLVVRRCSTSGYRSFENPFIPLFFTAIKRGIKFIVCISNFCYKN